MDKIHEECGVLGIWSNERTDVAEDKYKAWQVCHFVRFSWCFSP